MRAIAAGFAASVTQRLPSGPTVIPVGSLPTPLGAINWENPPLGVTFPINPADVSVNQRLPSGPRTIDFGGPVNPENSETSPASVIRPMPPKFPRSANHTLPSGPAAMPNGS